VRRVRAAREADAGRQYVWRLGGVHERTVQRTLRRDADAEGYQGTIKERKGWRGRDGARGEM
jgi:hypothetical protein